jgi:G6PDH family F420-dependent oxidoreductase
VTEFGYALSSEEHGPRDLVEYARRAEAVGFDFAVISDHYHPWVERQGQAPFVWNVLGGIAEATDSIPVGTGVTCPIRRIHPAVVAQAAATSAAMLEDRFFFGVGTGENLNEHVVGRRWPPFEVRIEMLEEAVAVIRELFEGEEVTHHGEHFTVENARLFTVPEEPPPFYVAAGGREAAARAAELGDGLVVTSPDEDVVEAYGDDGPRVGHVFVCYAETEREARETAYEWWPNGGLPGELSAELATPAHFEQAVSTVSVDDVADRLVCSPDPDDHVEKIAEYVDAGIDHPYVHQVGPDQESFCEFYADEVLPSFS